MQHYKAPTRLITHQHTSQQRKLQSDHGNTAAPWYAFLQHTWVPPTSSQQGAACINTNWVCSVHNSWRHKVELKSPTPKPLSSRVHTHMHTSQGGQHTFSGFYWRRVTPCCSQQATREMCSCCVLISNTPQAAACQNIASTTPESSRNRAYEGPDSGGQSATPVPKAESSHVEELCSLHGRHPSPVPSSAPAGLPAVHETCTQQMSERSPLQSPGSQPPATFKVTSNNTRDPASRFCLYRKPIDECGRRHA